MLKNQMTQHDTIRYKYGLVCLFIQSFDVDIAFVSICSGVILMSVLLVYQFVVAWFLFLIVSTIDTYKFSERISIFLFANRYQNLTEQISSLHGVLGLCKQLEKHVYHTLLIVARQVRRPISSIKFIFCEEVTLTLSGFYL